MRHWRALLLVGVATFLFSCAKKNETNVEGMWRLLSIAKDGARTETTDLYVIRFQGGKLSQFDTKTKAWVSEYDYRIEGTQLIITTSVVDRVREVKLEGDRLKISQDTIEQDQFEKTDEAKVNQILAEIAARPPKPQPVPIPPVTCLF